MAKRSKRKPLKAFLDEAEKKTEQKRQRVLHARRARIKYEARPNSVIQGQILKELNAPPEAWVKGTLSLQQQLFVDAYVGPAGGNATAAVKIVGLSNAKNLSMIGWQMLRNPRVQEAIAHAIAKIKMGPDWVKAGLMEIASSSQANFIRFDDNGKPNIDLKFALENGAMGQLKKYKEFLNPMTGTVERREIEVHDPLPARLALAKFYHLLTDLAERPVELPLDEYVDVLPKIAPPIGTTPINGNGRH